MKGNPKPEHEWLSEDVWKKGSWLDPGTFAESEDEPGLGSSDKVSSDQQLQQQTGKRLDQRLNKRTSGRLEQSHGQHR